MAYSVLTEQELLRLAEPPAENRREQVEQALNEAESRGWVFVGLDRTRRADAALCLQEHRRHAAARQSSLAAPIVVSDSR